MLNEFRIRAFKRFRDDKFRLGKLTVLAGLNGSGKSSLLQALLLTREASTSTGDSIRLNGPFGLQLGAAEDVLNWECDPPIELSVIYSGHCVAKWAFGSHSDHDRFLRIHDRPTEVPHSHTNAPRAFTYLSAERLGPRSISNILPIPDQNLEVGSRGEYCAHVLNALGNKPIQYPDRTHPLKKTPRVPLLKYEVESWLGEITRPVEITANRYPGSSVIELHYALPGQQVVRATNMGFGITYTLPVVLGGLIAEESGIFVVENPEAHLHPAGQSRVGVFLAWLAGRGVQVLLETHSDHVLNGIRRAISEQRVLPAADAAIHFFRESLDPGDAKNSFELTFNQFGNISSWPAGFFDQYQIDVSTLGKIRRGR